MTKDQLTAAVESAKTETRNALLTVYDTLNKGQKKQIVKDEAVRELFDRYGVDYTE